LKDAWICNIGVNFAILSKRGFNKNEVLLKCIDQLKFYFSINKWQINQPIILSDVVSEILAVEGVATIVEPEGQTAEIKQLIVIKNKSGAAQGYSDNLYNTVGATFNGVVYPPVDPTVFEVKYPDTDIQGRVMGDI
jgi:ribosomal protein S5